MCGRTACTLAPDDICDSTCYKSKDGKLRKPSWRDAPGGKKYYPSHNIAPGSHTPVMLSRQHFPSAEFEDGVERVIQPMKWGLVPTWHKGDPYKLEYETNNCRAEGMLTKRTYKIPLEKGRRCVILADGFFEWKRTKESKQPYFIYFPNDGHKEGKSEIKSEINIKKENQEGEDPKVKVELGDVKVETSDIKLEPAENSEEVKPELSGIKVETTDIKIEPSDIKVETSDIKLKSAENNNVKPINKSATSKLKDLERSAEHKEEKKSTLLTVAGVFEVWKPPDGSDELYSYSIITVDSSPAMAWIHHRMPAILTNDAEIEEWLDFGNVPLSKASKLIRPTDCLTMHPVSSIVNNSRNKSPECVKKIDPQKPKKSAGSNFMMNWLGKGKQEKDAETTESPSKRFKSQ
ncbi:abasic site processing protein HMCES isoform X1 [Patella vulgata]|uniref:abasic site processing protein HMCES isoform X1 n=2 Tax=Patella vulgata TaxID=6465 RepID=UPI002180644E|nr:abasic site processing protein HMCES isoform X1 [Patella vulgata]